MYAESKQDARHPARVVIRDPQLLILRKARRRDLDIFRMKDNTVKEHPG